jgi:hypothetical protein
MGNKVKLQKNEHSGSHLVTVPAQFVRIKGWEKSEELEWEEENGDLVLKGGD